MRVKAAWKRAVVGREIQPQRAGDLLHRLALSIAAHPRDADTDVDRRPYPGEEQIRLEVDLTIGDRDHVGRNVGRDLALEGLDVRQGRHRAAAVGKAVHPVQLLVVEALKPRLGAVQPIGAMLQPGGIVGPVLLGGLEAGGERAQPAARAPSSALEKRTCGFFFSEQRPVQGVGGARDRSTC